jgi:HAD superfamily hydrolase (TIGR01509 family)
LIKLIIFDLDGVLIDSKDIHYEALNKSLLDFGQTAISYDDHITMYDGKPTKDKLAIKGVDKSIHSLINNRKQEYTFEILENTVKEDEGYIDLFRKLKKDGFVVCVASNSISYTIHLVLFRLGVMRYVDHIISNQDVLCGKPNPEMYLKCMIWSKMGPKETLIVEDSYVGRQAVFNSGAHLCAVTNPKEVTYDFIINSVNRSNGDRIKWKGNNMNIVIPMAGAGSRFSAAGYTFPKPLIEVNGKPMIQVVVENLNIEGTYIFIVRKEHFDKYNLKYMLDVIAPGCKIVIVESLTDGAACTTLLAKEYINNGEQLLIANSDQWVDWDSSDFMYSMQSSHIDGGVLTFNNTHPKWSYAKVDENGIISEIREKQVISTNATVGIYHWKKGSDYVKYAEQMIDKGVRVNGEFYVAPVYNEAIADGKKFKVYEVSEMMGLGTPEDLNFFLNRFYNK